MKEIWIPAKDYEGLYEVCSDGRIKSLEKVWIAANGSTHSHGELIMKKSLDRAGYEVITLRKNNRSKLVKVHRLIAKSFISNPKNKPEVNHKNGNKSDNRVENLEWVTTSENQQHAINIGLITHNNIRGENNYQSKITKDQVIDIYNMASSGKYLQRIIASKYNISQSMVWAIKNKRTWKHILNSLN